MLFFVFCLAHSVAWKIEVSGNGVYCIQYDEQKLVAGTRTHVIKIYDLATLQETSVLAGHEGSVLCVQVRSLRVFWQSLHSLLE